MLPLLDFLMKITTVIPYHRLPLHTKNLINAIFAMNKSKKLYFCMFYLDRAIGTKQKFLAEHVEAHVVVGGLLFLDGRGGSGLLGGGLDDWGGGGEG